MRISDNGLAIVQAFEGCLQPAGQGLFKPYICPAGVLTIGWGHTNHHLPKFTDADRWTQAKCDEVLRGDMTGFEKHVERMAPEVKNQNRFDALVSWAYNTGGPASSSVWKYARAGDVAETRIRLARWNKGGGRVLNGLVRRREAEADLFEGKVDEALRTAGAKRPTPQEPSARTDRDRPQPTNTDIAKNTKGASTTAAAGAAAGGAGTQAKDNTGMNIAIGIGIVLFIFGIVLLVRKARAIKLDWA